VRQFILFTPIPVDIEINGKNVVPSVHNIVGMFKIGHKAFQNHLFITLIDLK
jgi:hypothetical protein